MTPAQFKRAREKLGLSQSALARALGTSRMSVWRYEHGESDIPRTVELALKGLEHEQS